MYKKFKDNLKKADRKIIKNLKTADFLGFKGPIFFMLAWGSMYIVPGNFDVNKIILTLTIYLVYFCVYVLTRFNIEKSVWVFFTDIDFQS